MRQLDMTLISANVLKDVNVQGKMDLYAVATLSCEPHNGKSTPIDRGCEKNANWNCPMLFNIPEGVDSDKLVVDILIRCQMRSADHDVGKVRILVKELESGGERKFVSYQVRSTPSGKALGVLDISYKFATPGNMPPPGGYSGYSAGCPERDRPPQAAGSPGSDTKETQPSAMREFWWVLGTVALKILAELIFRERKSSVTRDSDSDSDSDDDE